ncbi:PilZ domain-containing protein [bacterium]|nr:PilZ domain-containing protein [bacterium]
MAKRKNVQDHAHEKRKFPRLDAKYLVSYEYFDDEFTEDVEGMGLIQNLSLGGILVEIDKRVRLGAILFLEIALRDNVIKAAGKIVHIKQLSGDKSEVGVSFTDIEPFALEVLTGFFREKGIEFDTRA